MPGPDLLPIEEFADCARAALERDGATALNYGPPGGYPLLREWIAERHAIDPGRVIVTNGSLQGFSFVARHLVKGGARFFVEAPCYDRSLSILRRLGAEVEQVELADDGLDIDALAGALRAGDVVYTIPTFQNPSGRTLSRENRFRLVELARSRGALVFEDDPYGELRFDGDPLPRLFELADGEGVVFLSSFSKTVAPGIRTGYVILPEELVPEIEALVLENYVSPAIFVEAALYDFVTAGGYEPNLERVRNGLRIRRDAMTAALGRELAESSTWSRPEGGYFLWLDLPAGVSGEALLARATQDDVTFIKGADFFFHGGGEEAARLAYSFATAPEIDEGIGRLGRLVRDAAAVAAEVSSKPYAVGRLEDMPLVRSSADFGVRPVRLHFGINSFGINAYSARAGERVIEEHDELAHGAGRHEELYFVATGHATFELAGEEVDAPAGTAVFVRDPAVRRGAVAKEADTTVLVVGGVPGRAFEPSPSEAWLAAKPHLDAGQPDRGAAVFLQALERHPGNSNVLYNLACFESLAGRPDDALAHLTEAIELDPRMREWARADEDFAAIRDDPRFPG